MKTLFTLLALYMMTGTVYSQTNAIFASGGAHENNTGHFVQRTILQTDTQSTPEGIWNKMKAGCMIPVACSTLIHNSARAYVEDYDKSKSLVYNGEKLVALKFRIALYMNDKELRELKKKFRVDFITQYDMQDKKWIGISPDSFFTEYNQRNRK